MDFMKILKSLEEALYEVMVWLVFYPLTLWRVLRSPAAMMDYADTELGDADEDRYTDLLSPPIFLAITLGLAHALELALGQGEQASSFLSDDRNLLAFRMIAFSAFPLVLSVRLLRKRGEMLDRKILRPPFYSQCYVAAPYAAVVSSAPIVALHLPIPQMDKFLAMIGVILAATTWYLLLQARWFARGIGTSTMRGFGTALSSFLIALLLSIGLSEVVNSL